jgi:TetR/AcrR family transcriptional repressor of nem operon
MTKGDETRRQIIEKAAPIFNQHGFTGSSLAELMQATGLQKGGIYRHFKSKEELALEAFDYALTTVKNLRFAGVDPGMPSIDQLKKFIENFVECRSSIPGGCPLWNTAIDCDDGNPVLRERALAALQNWMTRLANIIERGIQNQEIDPEVEPEGLAALLISSLEGALVMKRLTNRTEPLKQVAQYLNEILDSHASKQSK